MRRHFGAMLLGATLTAVPAVAQTKPDPAPAPCKVEPDPAPCGLPSSPTPSNSPKPSQKFPFPADVSGAAAGSPNLNGVPDAPTTAPAAGTKKEFPFPGEPGNSAPAPAVPDATGSSSSSSSSGDTPTIDADGNPVGPALQDKGSVGAAPVPGRHILHRVNPVGTKLATTEERLSDDLDVAHFYVQSGDLKGAYLRSQDAVKIAPNDPDAHFSLAEIAQKLGKKDEAIAEYNACLKFDPTEKQAKEARKALAKLRP